MKPTYIYNLPDAINEFIRQIYYQGSYLYRVSRLRIVTLEQKEKTLAYNTRGSNRGN